MTITDAEIESLQKWGAPLDPQGMGALIKQAVHELLALRARVAEVKGERDRYLALLQVIAATHAPNECGTHTVCPDCDAVDHDPHRGSCAYEIARAARAPPKTASPLERVVQAIEAGHTLTVPVRDRAGGARDEGTAGLGHAAEGGDVSKTTPEKCGYCGHPRSWHSDAHGYGGLVSCCVGAGCACTEQQRDRLAALERVAKAARAYVDAGVCPAFLKLDALRSVLAGLEDLAPPAPDPDPPCVTCGHAESECTPETRVASRLAALERVAEAAKEVPCHECGFAIGATDDLRGETQCYSCAPVRTALVLLDHE